TSGALKFGRQFTGPDNLLRVLLMYFSDGCSMRETVARARAGNLAEVWLRERHFVPTAMSTRIAVDLDGSTNYRGT
ncbi:MAG: hypothetical protein Q8Q81_11335, partial [Oxalobacteraceae bacterium]|nr:hypothetical protein [Oxalobacteraceae bacterium]